MNESFDAKRFLSYLFIAAIALLFALQWGPGSVGCGKRGSPKTLLVEQGAAVSEDEVKSRYFKDYNKAQATFVKFSPTHFADKVPAPKAGEVNAWAAKNEQAVADYYKANTMSYFQDVRARARQILI